LESTIKKLAMLVTELERSVSELYETIEEFEGVGAIYCAEELENIGTELNRTVDELTDAADANKSGR
jgi:hypothetical protein